MKTRTCSGSTGSYLGSSNDDCVETHPTSNNRIIGTNHRLRVKVHLPATDSCPLDATLIYSDSRLFTTGRQSRLGVVYGSGITCFPNGQSRPASRDRRGLLKNKHRSSRRPVYSGATDKEDRAALLLGLPCPWLSSILGKKTRTSRFSKEPENLLVRGTLLGNWFFNRPRRSRPRGRRWLACREVFASRTRHAAGCSRHLFALVAGRRPRKISCPVLLSELCLKGTASGSKPAAAINSSQTALGNSPI